MRRKSLTSIIITVFVFALLMAGSSLAEDKVIKWTTQSIFPAGSSLYKEFEAFAKRVGVATNGRLAITTHPVGAVVGYREMIDALKTGILQGYYSSATFFSGKEPAFTIITGLPGGYENILQFESWFYQKGGIDFLRQAHKKFGNYPVGVVFYGRETLPCKVPIRTLADFKGKKNSRSRRRYRQSVPGTGREHGLHAGL
jgi:TRAP-type mannitol/chloroaromatic compound transport system substrate-binding protein